MSCISYAYNILVVSDGIYSINLGGLQADLNGGGLAGGAPPEEKEKNRLLTAAENRNTNIKTTSILQSY